MTSNRDRAAEVLREAFNELSPQVRLGGAEHGLIDRLAAAGVLAPDLPEPTWESTHTWIVDDLEIEAMDDFVYLEWADEMDDMRGTTTRSLHLNKRMVLAILAAAHAQKEETNE